MKNKKRVIWICFMLFLCSSVMTVQASSESQNQSITSVIEEQLELVDFNNIDHVLDEQVLQDYFNVGSFRELVKQILNGNPDFTVSGFLLNIFKLLFKEVRAHAMLITQIIMLALFSQLLKNLNLSFNNKDMSEIGFYAVYMTLILMLLKSLHLTVDIAADTVGNLYTLMESFLPTMLALIIASGNITYGAAQGALLLGVLQTLVNIIQTYIFPFVYFLIILEVINKISKQDLISQLLGFIKTVISKSMKYIVIGFSFIMGFVQLVPNVMDGIINKGAKYAMGSIPVVGGALSGVVDTVLSCANLIKTTVGIGAVIVIALMCILPILKIVALVLIYKLTAGVVQPVSDERIVTMLSTMGDYSSLILGMLFTVMFLFIAAITILVATTSIPMMMR